MWLKVTFTCHIEVQNSTFDLLTYKFIYQRMNVNCQIRFNSIARYNFLNLDLSARSFTNTPTCSKYTIMDISV